MTELYDATQPPAPVADVIGFNLGDLIVDEDVSKKGVWVDFYQGSKLLVASTSSGAYKAKLAKLARANKLILDDSNPDNFEAIQKITCEALATTVLLDWKGIHWPNADGTVQHNVRYSPALGMQALLKVDKLRDFVAEEAARAQNFKKETITEAKKP